MPSGTATPRRWPRGPLCPRSRGELAAREESRGWIDAAYRNVALADLAQPDIAIDAETDAQAWGETVGLADRFRLFVYDAADLELARRRGFPLATMDPALCGRRRGRPVSRCSAPDRDPSDRPPSQANVAAGCTCRPSPSRNPPDCRRHSRA